MPYPTALDTLTNPLSSDPRVGHAQLHSDVNDAVEAIEAKVGTGASTPTAGKALVGTGTGTSAWSSTLLKATVNLSSAQLLDLHNTPVTIVAAPGAGKYLLPHRSVVYFDYAAAAYTTLGNGLAVAYAADLADVLSYFDITASADRVIPAADASAIPAATAVNSALTATTDAAFADGDGTVSITIWYSIEDVPA